MLDRETRGAHLFQLFIDLLEKRGPFHSAIRQLGFLVGFKSLWIAGLGVIGLT